MSFFTPYFAVLNSWKESLRNANAVFSKRRFCTEESFNWQDFEFVPVPDSGTINACTVHEARWLSLGKTVSFSFYVTLTFAAATTYAFTLEMPFTSAQTLVLNTDPTSNVGLIFKGDSNLSVSHIGGAWVVGDNEVLCSGFLEVA